MSDSLSSLPIERQTLSGLLLYPDLFIEYETFVKDVTFSEKIHGTIYNCIKAAYLKNESLDKTILAQKIKNLKINFIHDEIDVFYYIEDLYLTQITKKGAEEAIKELISLKVRRDLCDLGKEIHKISKNAGNKNVKEILAEIDCAYATKVNSFSNTEKTENIYTDIEEYIEGLANDPPKESDLLFGPFKTVNKIYGSLLRPGAINLVGARTSVGKTSFGMFYLNWVAAKHDIPILHLDFSEMTKKELQTRAVCMLTEGKVPFHLVEKGLWRKNPELEQLVRGLWDKVKSLRMYYHDIGNLRADEIIALIKRVYYKEIGRGNRFIIHYDYLKPFNFDPRTPEYKEMGHFIASIKTLITNDIPACVWASLQLNRSGIVNGRISSEIDDSENAFSISDRIVQQTTHSWLLRPKLVDEIQNQGNMFGNMIFKNVKARHLGEEYSRHINPVKMPDGSFQRNYINLQADTFYFEEKGDLVDMAENLKEQFDIQKEKDSDKSVELK
jgi:replicative DNA helicase